MKRLTQTLPDELHARISTKAKAEGMSVNSLILHYIRLGVRVDDEFKLEVNATLRQINNPESEQQSRN